MPRQLDPAIAEVLKRYGYGSDACWNVHGTWVVYHHVIEQIAVKAGITFDPPMVLEANGENKTVALCVTGRMNGDASQWSIGEASPHNYQVKGKQAAYPYAMAEKRAKDRVVLKLIGLHGLAFSEDEADDFKEHGPLKPANSEPSHEFERLRLELAGIETYERLSDWVAAVKASLERGDITEDERADLVQRYKARASYIEQRKDAA